jgi:rhodanese-related sulfurtransferase
MASALRQIVAILLLALLPAGSAALWHPRRPAWQSDEVTVASAEAWGKNLLWVDARADADFAQGHIPGAISLNEDRWDDLLPAVVDEWDASRDIVVYCSSLSCQTSRDVARRLREEVNLPNVFVLQGGWEAWRQAHLNQALASPSATP